MLNSQRNLEKEQGAGGIILSDYTTKLQSYIKTVWYWHENRNIDQWNRYKAQK